MKTRNLSRAALVMTIATLAIGCSTASVDEAAAADDPPEVPAAPAPAAGEAVHTAEAEADEPEAPPQVGLEEAAAVLYPADEEARVAALEACPGEALEVRVRCMIERMYLDEGDDDETAAGLAVALYDALGTVAGREVAYEAEVGWRGRIQFVPALPAGSRKKREHLSWVVDGFEEIDGVLEALGERAGDGGIAYRWQALTMRFYRTVDRTTPSAYAQGWEIAWNLDGSLFRSKEAALDTLFHELFHLNDFDHDRWSRRELTSIFDAIIERCTEQEDDEMPSTRCLKPFAPSKTKVKGGTYYAFQPGNGVHEYAAELATRYFLEQRAWLADADGDDAPSPFKCGPEENARAWQLLVDEFFGGVDLVPACE